MSEPTPGPYHAVNYEIHDRHGNMIAYCPGVGTTEEEDEANAHLLAASWELREACERALASPNFEEDEAARAEMGAAFAAAKGEAPTEKGSET